MAVTNQLEIDINAKSKKATTSLDDLIAKLNEVNSVLNGLNTEKITQMSNSIKGLKGVHLRTGGSGGSNGGGSSVDNQYRRADSLLKTLTASCNKANKGFLNLNSTMVKMAATWGTFYAAAYPFMRLFDKAWNATQSGIDYVETYNYYSVTMKKMFSNLGEMSAEEFENSYVKSLEKISEKMTGFTVGMNGELFETYDKNLGADPEKLMNYQARIGAITNSVGLLGDTSVNTQKALSMLSQDLSSLTNTDLDSVMTNLSSGLIGQSRALYKYGIDITQATLKTIAYENGITKSVSAMTQSEKMQLRMLAILQQSRVAWGDMANTVNTAANQYRIFGQSVSNLSRVIGNLFIPIVVKTLPYINAMLISLRQIFSLLGFKIYGSNWLTDTLDGISGASFDDDIVDDIEEIGDASDKAAGKAKKLKQAVMGFDELNIISPDTSSGSGSGSGGGGSIDLSKEIQDALLDYESIWDKAFEQAENKAAKMANRITAFFKRGDFEGVGKWISDKLAAQLNAINWDRAYKGADKFGTGLAQFFNGLIQPSTFYSVGKTVANSLNTAIRFALSFGMEFDFGNLGDSIAAYLNAEFENFNFKDYGKTIGVWIGGITHTIGTAIKKIKWDKLFDGIKEAIRGFFSGLFASDVTISDITLVLGLVTISKILKLHWGSMVVKAISQQLARGLASRIGVDIAADAGIGEALAHGLAAQIRTLPAKLRGVWAVLGGTDEITGEYINLNKAFSDAFGTTATRVVGVGSAIGGVILSLHEFIDMWQNGWDIISEILKDMGIGLTAIGAILLGASAPITAIVAGIAAIGSTALLVAHDHMPKIGDTIKEVLSNPGGVSIGDLCSNVSEEISSIGDSFATISNKSEVLDTAKQNAKDVASDINLIAVKMKEGVITVEEGTERLKESFESLKKAADTYILGTEQVLLAAFGKDGAFSKAYENMGYGVEQTTSLIVQNTSDAQKELGVLYDKLNSGELEVGSEQWYSTISRIQELAGNTDDATKALESYKREMDGVSIDLNTLIGANGEIDISGLETSLGQISNSVKDTKQKVEDSVPKLKEAINSAINESADPETKAEFENRLQDLPKAIESINSDVSKQALAVSDSLQKDLIDRISGEFDQAMTDWDNMNWWEKIMSGADNADEYARMRTAEFKTKYIDPVSKEIETQYNELGIEGAGWGSAAAQKVIDGMFSEQVAPTSSGTSQMVTTLNSNWKDILDQVSEGNHTHAYKNGQYIIEGIGEGAKSESEKTSKEVSKSFFDLVWENICSKFGIHSPAEEMKPLGSFIFLGVVEGFKNKFVDWKKAIDEWFEQYVKPWFTKERWVALGQGIVDGLTTKWNEFSGWWKKTGFAKWWNEDVTPWFTAEKWLAFGQNIHDALVQKWNEFSDWWKTTGINKWWTEHVEPYFTEEKWTFEGIVNGMKKAFTKAINGVKQLWNDFADWINENLTWHIDPLVIAGKTLFEGADIKLANLPKMNIPRYQTGGFPEDGLFMANHSELVGQFSNGQTAVANNEQIVAGIQSGVATAVQQTLAPILRQIADNTGDTANNTDAIAKKPVQNITDRGIAKANLRGQRSLGLQLRTT